jgi:hypothetical protein
MKAEEMIQKYDEMKKELKILQFQLSRFEGLSESDVIETMTYTHPEGDRVITSGTSDKTFKVAANYKKVLERENNEWYDYLLKRQCFIIEELEFFEGSITTLQHAEIMYDMLINKISWVEIESKFNLSHATLGRYRKDAMKELNFLYALRDRQMESYLLS